MQSSSVSSDFTSKLLNFENASPTDNEIASLMDTTVRHEEPNSQTSSLYIVLVMVIPKIMSTFTTTIPPPPPPFNPLLQQATPTPTPTASEVTTSFPALPNFSFVFKFNERITTLATNKEKPFNKPLSPILQNVEKKLLLTRGVLEFATPVIERNVTESLEVVVLAKSSSQPKSTYEAAASLSEFELTKILMDKMEEHKSYLRADYNRELYDALVKSYNTDKYLFETYVKIQSLRSLSQQALLKEPPAPKHKSSGKSAHAEEPSYTVDDSGVQQNQEFDTGNNDEQPDERLCFHVNLLVAEIWKKPPTSFDELMDTSIDFSAFVMNRLNITNVTQELLVGPAFNLLKGTCKSHRRGRQVIPQDYFINNDLEYLKGGSLSRQYSTSITKTKAATYEGPKCQRFYGFPSNRPSTKDVYSRKRIIAVTGLKIMKWYDYGHLDEIEVHREDQELYKFKEGDFPRLHLQDIEDMRVEDLQLGVERYQKKLNLTKPDIFSPDLRNRTAYTAYSDPQGVIYEDQNNENRLMRTDELHKFSDGTLNSIRTALHDITSGIRIEYLPKRN
ncbi:hypothetical protein Tco_0509636 [Tanacetum coccineum]